MVKSFGKTADFKAFEKKSEYMYHIAWAKKIQTEKNEETGEEKELPLCDYWVEIFFYKPRMGKVIEKIGVWRTCQHGGDKGDSRRAW